MLKKTLLFFIVAAIFSGAAQASETFVPSEESIGGIRLGMSEKESLKSIGCHPQKNPEELVGATGSSFEIWTFKDCGIELHMVKQKGKTTKSVRRIIATHPGTHKTARGIGVGSLKEEVDKAYGRLKNTNFSHEMSAFVVTSAKGDGGMRIDIKDGKVDRIFLGPIEE